jgi:hypothetical protein
VDGALELHRVEADRCAPAARMAGGDDAGGEVHLRHQRSPTPPGANHGMPEFRQR